MVLKSELRHNELDESNVNKLLEDMFHECTKQISKMAIEHSSGPWNPEYTECNDKPLYIFRDVCQEQKNQLNIEYTKYQREMALLNAQKDAIITQKAYVERTLEKSLKHLSSESSILIEIDEQLQDVNIKLKKIKSLSKLNSDTNHSFAIFLHKIHAIPKCLICDANTDPPNAMEMCICDEAKYCSRTCQAADWNVHKMTCMAHKA
jgi:hypothetical protein